MAPPRLTTPTLAVLGAMLGDPSAEWYGLELSRRSGFMPGTIYPVLDRLLKAGWLERHWEEIDPAVEGRPKRRLYRLTAVGVCDGQKALDEHLVSLQVWPPGNDHFPRPRTELA